MKRFTYKAVDMRGKTLEGFMDAVTPEEVGVWLTERQFHVLEVAEAPFAALSTLTHSIRALSTREMNYFLLQLSNLLNAGCPLVMSLKALHRQLPAGNLKTLMWEIKEKIEMGKSFSESLKAYPKVFPQLFITMVEVGEVGGILDQVLDRYAQIFDAMYQIQAKIIKSMIYPALLLGMTLMVAAALLIGVFPVFIDQIESRGGVLPTPTRLVLAVSNVMIAISHVFFALPDALPVSRILSYPFFSVLFGILAWKALGVLMDTPAFRRRFDRLLLEIPLLNGLVRYSELALFARTLGTLLKCGVPILTSLTAVEKAQGNYEFKSSIHDIRQGVARGESLTVGMGHFRGLFPESLILMADVGERGGNMGNLMEKAAHFYERDLENSIEAVISLLEPGLVVFLSIFVVILAMAMYLPLFDIIKMVR